MPNVKKQPNGRYFASYRDKAGREHTKTFDKYGEAKGWIDTNKAALLAGTWRDPAGQRIRFGDYARDWLKHQRVRDQTRDKYDAQLRTHLLPTFGRRQLGSIRPTEVRAWRTGIDRKVSTVESAYRLFRSIMAAAVDDQLIASNPAQLKRTKLDKPAVLVPLTLEQVQVLADAVRPDLSALVLTAARSGLRQGELLGLTVDRVRFLQREIVVDRQMITPDRGEPRFAPPKTRRSERKVPVASVVLDVLAVHLEQHPPNRDGLVFHNRGLRWRRNALGHLWRQSIAPTGIDAGFHDLRHHYASLLIAAGCSVRAVSDVLGHASAVETLNTYAHLWPTDHDRIRDAVTNFCADFARTSEAAQ